MRLPVWGLGALVVIAGALAAAEVGVERIQAATVSLVSTTRAAGRGRAPDPSASLPGRLTDIQQAFLSNDAGRLARCFPRRGPVYVSIPPLQDGGFLAPGPLKAFLDRLVRERVSVGFDLPPASPSASGGRDATSTFGRDTASFVKVKWTHHPTASATLQVDYLHLALRYAAEDAEWQIVEIKTSVR